MSNIFIGKNNLDCTNALIDKLGENFFDKTARHIFIVPDKFSVMTEIKILEKLKLESVCNIFVMPLSRLADKVLDCQEVISKSESCMILQKLLKENHSKLKCFYKKPGPDLAKTLFETISQFKSCKIKSDEVKITTKNQLLSNKLEDIALLFEAYQNELDKRKLFDSADKLDFLKQRLFDCDFLKNSFVYVGYFDSFTFQGYSILSGLMKVAREFNIGVCFSDSQINSHIYEKKLFDNVLNIFSENKIKPNIINIKDSLTGQFKFLQNNLFSFNVFSLKLKSSQIEIFEAKSFEDEVSFCAKMIKNLMMTKQKKFCDFVVVVPNLEDNAKIIKRIFEEYNLNFFLDKKENFEESVLFRFIENTKEILNENFSRQSVLSFLKNGLIKYDFEKICDFEDYLLKYNIDNLFELKNSQNKTCGFFKNFEYIKNDFLSKFSGFLSFIKNAKTYDEFLDSFRKLFFDFEIKDILIQKTNFYAQNKNLRQAKLFEQYFNKLSEIFDGLSNILGNEKTDLNTFFDTLKSGVLAIKISTVLLSTNSIFVGDLSFAIFDRAKYYFVLGANEDVFPLSYEDCGLISDKDIDVMSSKYKLEPSIQTINSRERFKVFELLLKPTEKLFLSFNFNRNIPKSKIVEDISKMFLIESKKKKFLPLSINKIEQMPFLFNFCNKKTAKKELVSNLRNLFDGQFVKDEKKLIKKNIKTVLDVFEESDQNIKLDLFNFENNLKIKTNVFFIKDSVSVSQVEKYMTCPFLHFAIYAMKLNKKDLGEFDQLNVGKIMHDVAKIFLKQNVLPIDDNKVCIKAFNIFDEVIKTEIFESILKNPGNRVLIKNLKCETQRFCLALNNQAKFSKFKPIYTEARFDEECQIKSLKISIGNKSIKIVGQVDRIDKFENYFRIIDYKTGKCDLSFKELFFGKKIQLEVYLNTVFKSLKLKPAGAYYFPVKNDYLTEDGTLMKKYQLKGRTVNDSKVIFASDTRLESNESSDIVEVRLKSHNPLEHDRFSKVLKINEIIGMSEYALKLVELCCKDILTLDITPRPLNLGLSFCKNCDYYQVCRFDVAFKNSERSPKGKITIKNFLTKRREEDGKD